MRIIKLLVLAVMAAAVLAGCTPAGRNATQGAAAGTILGGAVGGVLGRTPAGIITGATIGAVSGAIIAANNTTKPPGWCVWRDRNSGNYFYAPCP